MDLRLRGKVAVVTGASKGIGLAVTKALVAEGVRVASGLECRTRQTPMYKDAHSPGLPHLPLLFVTLIMLSLSSSAWAEEGAGLTLSGNVSAASIESQTRFSFAGSLGYRFNQMIGVEFDMTAVPNLESRFPGAVDQMFPGPTFTNFGGLALVFAPNARFTVPIGGSAVEPFVVAGAGVASVRHTADFKYAGPPPGELPHVTSSEVDRVMTVGGGVGLRATPRLWIDVDLRLFRLVRDENQNIFRFGVGLRYRF